MIYLYLFKNRNGVINLVKEETAYTLIYATVGVNSQEFLGRVHEDEYKKLHPRMVLDSREYRKSLSQGNVELARAMEESNLNGMVSDVEADFSTKVSIFEKSMEAETFRKLIEMAEMVAPDENSNVTTPYGNREAILGAIKR